MITTTMEVMEQRGLPLDPKYMNVPELMKVAGVPKSTFYRAFGSIEKFYIELVEAMVEPTRAEHILLHEGTIAAAEEVIAKNKHLLRDEQRRLVPDVEGRRGVLHEVIRKAVQFNFENTYRMRAAHTYAALAAALPSLRDDDLYQRARDLLAAADSRDIQRMADFYAGMLAELGWRFKDNFQPTTFAAAAAAIVNGLAVRATMNPSATDSIWLEHEQGNPTEWHPAAVGFLAVLDGMSEPIESRTERGISVGRGRDSDLPG
ncbi:hypothetical protein ACWIGI_04215 [Nocardia sp. NPDC055321]